MAPGCSEAPSPLPKAREQGGALPAGFFSRAGQPVSASKPPPQAREGDLGLVPGGRRTYWAFSQGEIKEMLEEGGTLHPEIAALLKIREEASRLFAAIRAEDTAKALSALAREPKVAYVRDSVDGGFASHLAAFHGLEEVVATLAKMPGVPLQGNRQRQRPLQVAQQRLARAPPHLKDRLSAVCDLLLAAEPSGQKPGFAERSKARPSRPQDSWREAGGAPSPVEVASRERGDSSPYEAPPGLHKLSIQDAERPSERADARDDKNQPARRGGPARRGRGPSSWASDATRGRPSPAFIGPSSKDGVKVGGHERWRQSSRLEARSGTEDGDGGALPGD
eukprot:jgi/Botrbrau1/11736/Bobra.0195s0063.1